MFRKLLFEWRDIAGGYGQGMSRELANYERGSRSANIAAGRLIIEKKAQGPCTWKLKNMLCIV